MKRISLVLLGVLFLNTLAIAQLRNFEQRGGATHNVRGDGLVADHPSLAIGTKVMVVNTLTGKEIEVTINGRIPPSVDRIVDLSQGAWQELGMSEGTPVRIYMAPQSRPRNPDTPVAQLDLPPEETEPEQTAVAEAEPDPEDSGEELAGAGEPEETPEIADSGAAPDQLAKAEAAAEDSSQNNLPYNLTINNYVNTDEAGGSSRNSSGRNGSDTEFLAWLTTMMMDARDARETREAREAREYRESRETESREYRDARERAREAAREDRYWLEYQEHRNSVNLLNVSPNVEYVMQPATERPNTPSAASNDEIVQDESPKNPPDSPPPRAPETPAANVRPPAQTGEIQIIPGLPDRFSGKKHDIQIGAYSAPEAAARLIQLVRGAGGFEIAQEMQGSIHRVLVMGIPAAEVYDAIQRLAALGLRQFWVRD